jgi:hypothetical protein
LLIMAHGDALRIGQGLLKLGGEFIQAHVALLPVIDELNLGATRGNSTSATTIEARQRLAFPVLLHPCNAGQANRL